MTKIEKLEKRIAELEDEIMKLKVSPPSQVIHNHYYYSYAYATPVWQPLPVGPTYPYITYTTGAGVQG